MFGFTLTPNLNLHSGSGSMICWTWTSNIGFSSGSNIVRNVRNLTAASLALPVLPLTTPEARQYFFKKVKEYATLASSEGGKGKINYEAFAQEWNKTADGKYRFYVTIELLAAYAKSWEKNGNICASQDMILDKLYTVSRSAQVFSASTQPFPSYLTSSPHSTQPSQGVLEVSDIPGHELAPVPSSISTALALSHPSISQLPASESSEWQG